MIRDPLSYSTTRVPNHVALTAFTQQQLERQDTQQCANQHLNEYSPHICQGTFIEKNADDCTNRSRIAAL